MNAAAVATYLAGTNTRRIRGALAPLLKNAPLSKSAVSRVGATLRESLQAWMSGSLADVDGIVLYLDAIALRVRRAGRVVSLPVLDAVGVLPDGRKQLLALECCGGESAAAWRGFVEDLARRGVAAPVLCIIDGHPGLRRAVGEIWPAALVQRCCVHELRNLERNAPKHALAELREDFHRIVYAAGGDPARAEVAAFERKWAKRCPGVVRSLQEGGAELLTFFTFPRAQWKTLRTTNVIGRARLPPQLVRRRLSAGVAGDGVRIPTSLRGQDGAVLDDRRLTDLASDIRRGRRGRTAGEPNSPRSNG